MQLDADTRRPCDDDDVLQLAEASRRVAASRAVSEQVTAILQERVEAALAKTGVEAEVPWVTLVSTASGFMGGNLERRMPPREARPTAPSSSDEKSRKPKPKKRELTTRNDRPAKNSVANRAEIDSHREGIEREAADCRLRELRQHAGYTQTALAKLIGVGKKHVSQMEHGQIAAARIATLRKYVEATGCQLEVTVKCSDGSRVLLAI